MITNAPIKILGTLFIQDTFYLNLGKWSFQDTTVVALGRSVHLWSATPGCAI